MSHSTASSPQAKAPKRKSTGKRLRFSVFHRDHFTCQYCGAQPPDVILVCDHIQPVALGGETTIDNLITACQTCNQGKADKSLGDTPIRPDADILFLETQQELSELRRYADTAAKREAALHDVTMALLRMWMCSSGLKWHPEPFRIVPLILKYGPEIVEQAIVATAPRVRSGLVSDNLSGYLAYMTACCRNIADDIADDDSEEGE